MPQNATDANRIGCDANKIATPLCKLFNLQILPISKNKIGYSCRSRYRTCLPFLIGTANVPERSNEAATQ